MKIEVGSIIMLLAALQGIILSIFILKSNVVRKLPNYLLAILLIIFSLDLILVELFKNFYIEFPHLIGLTDCLIFAYGPLIYKYVASITGKINKLTAKSLIHFIPFIISLAYMIPFYLESSESKLLIVNQMLINGIPKSITIRWFIGCIHVISYLGASLLLFRKYGESLKENYTYIEKINLNWLRMIIIGNATIWLIDTALLIMHLFSITLDSPFFSQSLSYLMAILIYSMAYKALTHHDVFIQMKPRHIINTESKYSRSGLTALESNRIKEQLTLHMKTNSPHLEPDLTLTQLSAELSIPNNYLSQVINQIFKQSFFDFINKHRVKEAMQRLVDQERSKATMLAIAYDSGFKSKSTFNAAFKKHTGLTPSQFKKSSQQENTLKTA